LGCNNELQSYEIYGLIYLDFLHWFCHGFCSKNTCQNLYLVLLATQGVALGYNDIVPLGLLFAFTKSLFIYGFSLQFNSGFVTVFAKQKSAPKPFYTCF